jgi:hypothetical protein
MSEPSTDAVTAVPRKSNVTVQNCTPDRLILEGDGDAVLVLSPLERDRVLSEDEVRPFALGKLVERGILTVRRDSDDRTKVMHTVLGLLPMGFVIYVVAGIVISDAGRTYWLGAPAGFALALGVFAWLVARGGEAASQALVQAMSLFVAVLLAIGLPVVVIYMFGGQALVGDDEMRLALLGRGLQLLFIATAALLPALLYYLFDRHQLATLRERFEQQIFRFDREVKTLGDVRARYGRQMEEIFGRDDGRGERRLRRAKRWPIQVATLVITLGWLLVLMPVNAAGAPPAITDGDALLALFTPGSHPVVFGFLGAYFFALLTVLHRYVRRDLKPAAYATITVRVFIAVIIGWVAAELVTPGLASAFAFFAGIVPESGVAVAHEFFRSRVGTFRILPDSYEEKHPLTRLEGISFYDLARLEDEGLTNVQSIAHHDIIDLMIETRIPVPRIIDWVDQAILYLHVHRMQEEGDDWMKRLHGLGIRNATDLLRVHEAATGDGASSSTPVSLDDLLADPDGSPRPRRVGQLHALVACIQDDEWLTNVKDWRKGRPVQELKIDARSSREPVPTEEQPLPEVPAVQPA